MVFEIKYAKADQNKQISRTSKNQKKNINMKHNIIDFDLVVIMKLYWFPNGLL